MSGCSITQALKCWWHERKGRFMALPEAERWWQVMFWTLWLYLLFFSFGPRVRDILPSLCALCLFFYYRHNWEGSVLRRFGARWLFIFFFAAALWGAVFSQDLWASLWHVARGVNKAFVLPFVAMECVRSHRDLRRLVWALALACLWQGCNGVYQSITGFDFVDHTPIIYGRLTGSLSDYRVGNYMALALIPAASLWFMLRQRLASLSSLAILLVLLTPGLYLLYFTYTRNAYVSLMVAPVLWYTIVTGKIHWKPVVLLGSVLLVAGITIPQRLGVDILIYDGRWDLWRFAWAIFLEDPWFGAGFGRFNEAFRALGLAPTKDPITISHPHSIYLQLLSEAGAVGLVLALVFLLGMLYWGYTRIRPHLVREQERAREARQDVGQWAKPGAAYANVHWRMTAVFWCGWAVYLISGLFGHDYFRTWWQAMVMTNLGIMIGAVISGADAAEEGRESDSGAG